MAENSCQDGVWVARGCLGDGRMVGRRWHGQEGGASYALTVPCNELISRDYQVRGILSKMQVYL